jgi:hypothetical protein
LVLDVVRKARRRGETRVDIGTERNQGRYHA